MQASPAGQEQVDVLSEIAYTAVPQFFMSRHRLRQPGSHAPRTGRAGSVTSTKTSPLVTERTAKERPAACRPHTSEQGVHGSPSRSHSGRAPLPAKSTEESKESCVAELVPAAQYCPAARLETSASNNSNAIRQCTNIK